MIPLIPQPLKGQLDKEYYINLFEQAIMKSKSELILVPESLRGFGKTTMLNEIGLLAQNLYNKNVYVISPHPKIEYVCDEVFAVEDVCRQGLSSKLVSDCDVVILDDIRLSENVDLNEVIRRCHSLHIPVIGFIYEDVC